MTLTYSEARILCERWVNQRPQLNDPDYVLNRCYEETQLFCTKVRSLSAIPLELLGYRSQYPHRHPNFQIYPDPDPDFCHTMCYLEEFGWVIDFTYKQFDTTHATAYHLVSYTQICAEWLLLSKDFAKYIDPYLNISTHLMHSTRAWQDARWRHHHTTEEKLKDCAEHHKQACKAYRKTQSDFTKGHLIATGTADDNFHLRRFYHDWRHLAA